jgi:hypothetical protein
VWSSGIVLLEALEASGAAKGRHILELGCGTGVVAIACLEALGRGFHSLTSQLNLSAFNGIGGAHRGCVARVRGVLGGV